MNNKTQPMKRSSSNCCFNCVSWVSCAWLAAKYKYISPNNPGRCEVIEGYSMGFEVCDQHERREDMPEGSK